jgi:hypothetical protein
MPFRDSSHGLQEKVANNTSYPVLNDIRTFSAPPNRYGGNSEYMYPLYNMILND